MRTRRPHFFCLCLGFLALLARGVLADGPIPGSRIVKSFDFEEIKLGNFEATPMFWSKVTGRGFPAYSAGAFDHTVFHSGENGGNTSFKMRTVGGSVAYRYDPPPANRIPVAPNSDYYIIAFARTDKLEHARADLAAWFTDDKGQLLLDTETHSQPYKAGDDASTNDAWQVLYIHLPTPPETGDGPPQPRFLAIQAGLLQPQQQAENTNPLGRFALYQQDIEGSAWFDDIVIFQLPRIGITVHKQATSPAPAGMFGGGEKIDLDMLVSDVRNRSLPGTAAASAPSSAPSNAPASAPAAPGSPLLVRLKLAAADGTPVDATEFQANARLDEPWTHRYTHSPLPGGLYTATMEVFDPSAASSPLVANRQVQFLCLPAATETAHPLSPEFGVDVTRWNHSATWQDLPSLAIQTGAGLLQLPAWRGEMDDEALTRRDAPLDALLATLQRRNIRTLAAFSELPGPIAAQMNPESRTSLLALNNADPKIWQSAISFPLTRYVNRIDFWQLGSPDDPFSGLLPDSGDPRTAPATAPATPDRAQIPIVEQSATLYGKLSGPMMSLLPQPGLMIPWNALFEFHPEQFPHAELDLRIPAVVKPAQIPAYLGNFQNAGRPLFVQLDGLPANESRRADRLADFAERLVYSRSAKTPPDAVLYPARPGKPDELLLVYRTMIHALGQSNYVGEITPGPGMHAFLFEKPGDSSIVIWSDAAGETALDLPLGSDPRSTDLLGNPRALAIDPATQLTHLNVTSTPQVIENVDPRPLQLTASFALASSRLPAGVGSIHDEVLLSNPYPEQLAGTLRLSLPPHWTADPDNFPISLSPGSNVRLPLELSYPFSETAGVKHVTGQLHLDPGNPSGQNKFDLSAPVSVGSDLIEMEAFCFVQEDGDILLQQVITNTSSTPLNAQAYALVPGFPREQRYVVGLAPHQTTIKRYTFSPSEYIAPPGIKKTGLGLATLLAGQVATLGVRQSDGQVLLTKAVPLE